MGRALKYGLDRFYQGQLVHQSVHHLEPVGEVLIGQANAKPKAIQSSQALDFNHSTGDAGLDLRPLLQFVGLPEHFAKQH
jgi:hypothetical protein